MCAHNAWLYRITRPTLRLVLLFLHELRIFPRFACLFCSLFLASIAFVSLSLLSSIYWCLCGAFYGSRAFRVGFCCLCVAIAFVSAVAVGLVSAFASRLSADLVRLHPWMCSCGQFARPSSLPVLASRCLRTSLRLRRLTWLRPVHLSSARLAPSSGYVPFYPRGGLGRRFGRRWAAQEFLHLAVGTA